MVLIVWLTALGTWALPLMEALVIRFKFPLKIYEIAFSMAMVVFTLRGKLDFPKGWKIWAGFLTTFLVYCFFVLFYRRYYPGEGFNPEMIIVRFGAYIDSLTKLFYFALNIIAFALVVWLGYKRPKLLINAWLWGATFSALYAIYLATFSGLHLNPILLPGISDPQFYRGGIIRSGTFLEGNYAGLYFLLSLCLAFHMRHYWKVVILSVATLTTFSTPAFLLLFVIVFFHIWVLSKQLRMLQRFTVLFGVCAIFVSIFLIFIASPLGQSLVVDKLFESSSKFAPDDPTFSREDRINTATVAWKLFELHPLIGVGLAQYPYYFESYNPMHGLWWFEDRTIPNNVFLEILCENGLIGSLLFFGFIYYIWTQLCRSTSFSFKLGYFVILAFWVAFPTFSVMYVWTYWALILGVTQRELEYGQTA